MAAGYETSQGYHSEQSDAGHAALVSAMAVHGLTQEEQRRLRPVQVLRVWLRGRNSARPPGGAAAALGALGSSALIFPFTINFTAAGRAALFSICTAQTTIVISE